MDKQEWRDRVLKVSPLKQAHQVQAFTGQIYDLGAHDDPCEIDAQNIAKVFPVMRAVTAKHASDDRRLEVALPSVMRAVFEEAEAKGYVPQGILEDSSVFISWEDALPWYVNEKGFRTYLLLFGRSTVDAGLMHATFPDLKLETKMKRNTPLGTAEEPVEVSASNLEEVTNAIRSVTEAKLPEPAREPKGPHVSTVQIVSHPGYWGKVMQVQGLMGGQATAVLLPNWCDYEGETPIPPEANFSISDDCIQSLFNSLWQQGYRPTGTTVILETSPEGFPEVLRHQMEEIALELTEATGQRHYFEDYWGEGSTDTAVLWRDVDDDISVLDPVPVEEFDSLNRILVYVQGYYATEGEAG